MRRRVVVVDESDTQPFWLRHILSLIAVGVVGLIVGIVLLSLTEVGRATLVWAGLAVGLFVTAWLARGPWRSFRAQEPAVVWAGGALVAFGFGGWTTCMTAGIPFFFWLGLEGDGMWPLVIVGFIAIAGVGMWMLTRGPLPVLDRTSRNAQVVANTDDADGGQSITVQYRGVDGEQHEAELAELIDDSWRKRFSPGTTWQVYAFRDAALADTVVFLTEDHEDVWRDGYKLNGVRMGAEGGPVQPGPGSPFLRDGGKWKFES